jgi:hypothetical protein
MSDLMRVCKPTEPVMVAWKEYQGTGDFANSKKWAIHTEHVQGSIWAAFSAGFAMATERAAMLHESVNPASDDERLNHVPGAGGMGAVIQYRDMIRAID